MTQGERRARRAEKVGPPRVCRGLRREIFAKAHARDGDAAVIAAYCGVGTRFDRALGRFALAYADQTTADYERFRRAIRTGRVRARRGI